MAVSQGTTAMERGNRDVRRVRAHHRLKRAHGTFPAKLREELGEHFYISKTIGEACLTVHTEHSWNALRESLKGKPQKVRLPIERFLFGGACEAEPDKQGRIAIAPALRAYAGLTSEVVVVGMDDHAEIWDKAAYRAYTESISTEDIAALAEEIGI